MWCLVGVTLSNSLGSKESRECLLWGKRVPATGEVQCAQLRRLTESCCVPVGKM